MQIVETDKITQASAWPKSGNTLQVYCGLDSMLTLEIMGELRNLRNEPPAIYGFSRALQAPYLEIMQRGFAVDRIARTHAAEGLRIRIEKVQTLLNRLAVAAWGKPLNPRSPQQLRDFFYSAMRLPEVWISQKGERKLSTNREALEKLEQYMQARPFISCILTIRDLAKQLEVFATDIDADGRFRTSYNVAGTETGRMSSSENAFGTGGNAQNISPALRYVFVADPGWKLCVIDLEQVEARDVGFFCGTILGDWSYLDACESGDLHTTNATRIWPELPWPGDPKGNRKFADQIFYREFTYRDMAKRGSHLSNYYGQAWTMARALKIPPQLAIDFQDRYCKGPSAAFPCIPQWWQWVAMQLQTTHQLITPFGRQRHFFGRPGDDTTLREAIAFLPQSTTGDRMNVGVYRIWKHMPQVQLLAQTFDSVSFQYRESDDEDAIVTKALDLLQVELRYGSRRYVVPGEAKIGWNWGNAGRDKLGNPTNPEGLIKWNPSRRDDRVRRTGLQRIMFSQ